MWLRQLQLDHFRNYDQADLALHPGVTVVTGDNGQGKTNLLEAVGVVATMRSFRGSPTDALIGDGAASAFVRAEVAQDHGAGHVRAATVEIELARVGRNRVLVNRQSVRHTRDLLGILRVSVFTPDDLDLVKGGPGGRRALLDDTLGSLSPRFEQGRADVERILRQRNALLRQSGGRATEDVVATLAVWDERLAEAGTALADARAGLVERLEPRLVRSYAAIAGRETPLGVTYEAPWRAHPGGLAGALADARRDDLRRGVTTVGPHRDDVEVTLDGAPARTHASQGEQRSLTLGIRLAVHELVSEETDTPPVLLLDDVFSELDPGRTRSLVAHLPPHEQLLLTTATGVPEGITVDHLLRVRDGALEEG